jgi:hypothetical protein
MGSRKSSSNASSTNTSNDNRQVYDAGGGIAGNGNAWDQSTNWTNQTSITDARSTSNSGNTAWDWAQTTNNTDNRSTSNSGNTSWTQSDSNNTTWTQDTTTSNSGNTTWTSDSSNRSNTTWNWTTTDGGAIKGMTDIGLAQADLAGKVAQIASTNATKAADTAATAAIRAQENALSTAGDALSRAFAFAQNQGTQAAKSNADALGMVYEGFDKLASMTGHLVTGAQKQADSAAATVQAAYSSAASQANGNKTLTLAAMAVVGVIGAALLLRKWG